MPTKGEFEELLGSDKCTWTWETVDNVNGYTVTSNVDGYADKSIFLPASGFCKEKKNGTFDANVIGYYWSSTLVTSNTQYAYFLAFIKDNDTHQIYDYVERYYGYSVRAVATKPE